MRPPQDKHSQRNLVPVLAHAIDLCMSASAASSPGSARLREANLYVLLEENPHAAFSRHVMHNIGPRRARWLREYAEARARARAVPSRSDTRSRS